MQDNFDGVCSQINRIKSVLTVYGEAIAWSDAAIMLADIAKQKWFEGDAEMANVLRKLFEEMNRKSQEKLNQFQNDSSSIESDAYNELEKLYNARPTK